MEATVRKIVDKESAAIGNANNMYIEQGTNVPAFVAFVGSYYAYNGPFIKMVREEMYPTVRDFMHIVHIDALETVNNIQGAVPMDDGFVRQYVKDFAIRMASSSARQLRKIIRDSGSPKMGKIKKESSLRKLPEQYTVLTAEEIAERVQQWKLKRPGIIAEDEAIRESNAQARESWRQSGVTKLKWEAVGKSCPFCNQLNGKIVGIQSAFMEDGEVLYAKGEETQG